MENNYKITPLTVEISVLKIGKKQCTIAVFKQLKEERIIPEMIDEIEIWGEVYYSQEWYIIYSYNKEIYKCLKSFKKVEYMYFYKRYTLADVPKLIIKERKDDFDSPNYKLVVDWINNNPENLEMSISDILYERPSFFFGSFQYYLDSEFNKELNSGLTPLLRFKDKDYFYKLICYGLEVKNGFAVILEGKVEQHKLECECIDKYNGMINSLDNLPQLFIAV